jgi:hypothetical protein
MRLTTEMGWKMASQGETPKRRGLGGEYRGLGRLCRVDSLGVERSGRSRGDMGVYNAGWRAERSGQHETCHSSTGSGLRE